MPYSSGYRRKDLSAMERGVAGSSETSKSLFCHFFSMFFYMWLTLFP